MFVPFVFNMTTFGEAPYLWWFYVGLDFAKKTHSAIIAQEIYCTTPPSAFAASGRKEAFNKQFAEANSYQLPKNRDLVTERIYQIPDSLLDPIIREKGSIGDAFCHLLAEPDDDFCEFLDALLSRIERECGEKIEGFITLMANPSLSKVAKERNIPVIHFELGCLRNPNYLSTAFWDLESLYGSATVASRWERFQQEHQKRKIPLFSKRESLALLLRKEKLKYLNNYYRKPVKKTGAVLGYVTYELFSYKTHLNDSEMLYRLKNAYGLGHMLIRKHPGDPYGGQYPVYMGSMDVPGRGTPEFILDCETIVSLISGMCTEAMLWGRKAITLLPCPSYFASGHEIEGEGKCAGEDFTSFFAFCYLIPREYLMDVDYLRWRLSGPTEREIYFKHLEYYFKKKGIPTELILREPGERLDDMLAAQGFRLSNDEAI